MPLLIFFSILVKGKYDFLVKVADFHTRNVIFKVEYLTEEQKRARIFNGFVQSDDKRNQKLQHCAYPLISGLKLFKMHHSAVGGQGLFLVLLHPIIANLLHQKALQDHV